MTTGDDSTRQNPQIQNWELVAEFMRRMAHYTDIESEQDELGHIAWMIEENIDEMKDHDRR